MLQWPGQIVIAGCQTHWTKEVSEALEKNELKDLFVNLKKQVCQLLFCSNTCA